MSDELFDLKMTAPGEWSGAGDARFERPDGSLFGGYSVGLLLSATLREPELRGTPVTLTGAFLNRVSTGPLKVTTKILRAGRSLQVWQAGIVQADKLCNQVTVTVAQRPAEGLNFSWVEAPAAPPPESLPRETARPGAWADNFDRRLVRDHVRTPSDGISLMWARESDPVRLDHAHLAMMADMFPPRSNLAMGQPGATATATISNSIYFHATQEEIAEVGNDFILMHGRGRRGSHGVCDLSAEIWRRDGRLLATTEQMWWFSLR